MNEIGGRILFARRAKGITQEQLADAAGLSVRTLQRIERGAQTSTSLTSLTAIAKALNMTIERLVTGFTEAQLERLRDENLCPHCSAPLIARVPIEHEYGSDDFDVFECGYETGMRSRPCPSQPGFPTLEQYELTFHAEDDRWRCSARGMSESARSVHIAAGFGGTKDEAEAELRSSFARISRRYGENE